MVGALADSVNPAAYWRSGERIIETKDAFKLIQSAYAADKESFNDIKMMGV